MVSSSQLVYSTYGDDMSGIFDRLQTFRALSSPSSSCFANLLLLRVRSWWLLLGNARPDHGRTVL